jgi:phosphomannomutase
MRPSGQKLSEAFACGATEAGADVVDIGMVSTDALYFAVGEFELDGGVMITASHNPAEYNGMKFTSPHAEAISLDSGLATIRERLILEELPPKSEATGTITRRDVLDDFAQHCLSFVDRAVIKPFRIAVDAGNGMAGESIPHAFKSLPLRDRAAQFRARRKFSEPSGESDRTEEYG